MTSLRHDFFPERRVTDSLPASNIELGHFPWAAHRGVDGSCGLAALILMSYRSNAAEAWYAEPSSAGDMPLDLLPPPSLTQPLWRSLIGNLRDTFATERLPPLILTSRPVNIGLALGERLRLPWFRTVFTNIGDVLSPEVLPPLELKSQP